MTLPAGWVFKEERSDTGCEGNLCAGLPETNAEDVWFDSRWSGADAASKMDNEWTLESWQALGALAEEILRRRNGSPARRAAEQTAITSLLNDAWRRNASPAFARP